MASVTQQTHELLAARVRGELAVDATAGNGHDTEFLARLIGPTGTVWAFDIQPRALLKTAMRLREQGISVELHWQTVTATGSATAAAWPSEPNRPQVVCIEASHDEMGRHLPVEAKGQIAAVMFNLGYLPGSDKSCITMRESTLAALHVAWEWLAPGGVLTVVAYPGHAGGRDEADAVGDWFSKRSTEGSGELLSAISPETHHGPQLFAMFRVRREEEIDA